MKTLLKIIFAVTVLFIFSVLLGYLSSEKQTTVQNHPPHSTSNAETGSDKSATDMPNLPTQKGASEGNGPKDSRAPNSDDKKAQDVKGEHKEIVLRGVKLSDWISITALAGSVLLGVLALVFSALGLRQNQISNERQNRAYLTVDSCKVRKTAHGIEVAVKIKNVGATPANDINLTHWFGTARDYSSKLPRNGNVAQPAVEGNFFLGPSDTKMFYQPMEGKNMPAHIILGLLTGEWSLLFDGDLTYVDEFKKKHRLLYHFRKKTDPQKGFFGEMSFAKEGLQRPPV